LATIREYFDKAAERLLTAARTVKVSYPHGDLEIPVQVHYDFDAPAKYISLFVPESQHWRELCMSLLLQIESLLKSKGDVQVKLPATSQVYGGYQFFNHGPEHPIEINGIPLSEPKIPGDTLPFTGTVFIYSDNEAPEIALTLLKDFARQNKLILRWRGLPFARERSLIERPVAFISHDSRDKEEIARPLAVRLQQMLCPVWFDEFALAVGDSLRDKIEKGLKETAKCVVILSPNFLANKRWTKVEFDSVFTREIIEERNVFLPIWLKVSVKDVYDYSPSLANRIGIDWSLGIDEVSRRLYNKISEATTVPSESNWRGQSK
jgi:hypothetical protein